MKLLLIRHAIAEDKDEWAKTGKPDDERPLTKDGKWKMQRVAKGLKRAARGIDVLASSPLVRAQQTAQIVAKAYGGLDIVTVEAMSPDREFPEFLAWLRKQREAEVVAAIGHEPHIGGLATWLLSGGEESHTPFGKGGAALLEFEKRPAESGAQLVWAMTPALLRGLGE